LEIGNSRFRRGAVAQIDRGGMSETQIILLVLVLVLVLGICLGTVLVSGMRLLLASENYQGRLVGSRPQDSKQPQDSKRRSTKCLW
jgi:hypothetical protein